MVVEDNKADVFLIREAIESAGLDAELHVMADGEKAIRFFDEVDSDDATACPTVVIIDINLPRRSGGEVLEQMRKHRRCANARVVVVTSSDSARDREEMARLGVDAYFPKASDYEAFLKLGGIVKALID